VLVTGAARRLGRVIALDSTANLKRTLHNLQLRVRIDGAVPDAIQRAGVVVERDTLVFSLRDYTELEPALATLREHG